jgi:polar amino acid transport system substrate-binding protein
VSGAGGAPRRQAPGPRRLGVTLLGVTALAAAALAAAGCAAGPPAPAAAASPAASRATAAGTAPAASASGTAAPGPAASSCDPDAVSLAPDGPPQVTAGSYMAAIKKRGYLIAGVDQSTYHFGYLNPLDGNIEGFDIDMIRAVAQAIFGSPDKVRYKAISDAQRIPAILDGSVDIVAHTMTITCDRQQQVDFSSVYFESHQRVLVPDNSPAKDGLADLGGQPVCATTGSDSVDSIEHYPTHPRVVQVPYWTDCLVLLQQDQVAAISTDDSILDGLAVQDPFTKVVGPPLTNEPYGLAMSKQHPDFVRFVNAVLARERSDGAWKASYLHWIGSPAETPPAARYAS